MAKISGTTQSRVNNPIITAIEQNSSAKITSDNDKEPPIPIGSKCWLISEKFDSLFIPCVSIIAQIATRTTSNPNETNGLVTLFVDKNFCNSIV